MRIAIGFTLAAAVTLSVGFFAARYVREANRSVDSVRRVNGDVVILAYTPSFPNGEKIRDLATRRPYVERAGVFAISPVQAKSAVSHASALLKLQTFDEGLTRQLRSVVPKLPRPRAQGQPAELVVGNLLAERLRLDAGDLFTVRAATDVGIAEGPTVPCRVSSVVDWGHEHHNDQLLYGDLSHALDFDLPPVGIEVVVNPPIHRSAVARDLQSRLGSGYKTMTFEELVYAR